MSSHLDSMWSEGGVPENLKAVLGKG